MDNPIISRLEAFCFSCYLVAASADWLTFLFDGLLRRIGGQAQERVAHRGGRSGAERADEEGGVESAIQRGDLARSGGQQASRARGGETCENCETKRAAHHERGVDDPGGEA